MAFTAYPVRRLPNSQSFQHHEVQSSLPTAKQLKIRSMLVSSSDKSYSVVFLTTKDFTQAVSTAEGYSFVRHQHRIVHGCMKCTTANRRHSVPSLLLTWPRRYTSEVFLGEPW